MYIFVFISLNFNAYAKSYFSSDLILLKSATVVATTPGLTFDLERFRQKILYDVHFIFFLDNPI